MVRLVLSTWDPVDLYNEVYGHGYNIRRYDYLLLYAGAASSAAVHEWNMV